MYEIIFYKSGRLKKDISLLKKNKSDFVYTHEILKEFKKNPFSKEWNLKKKEPKTEDVYRLKFKDIRILFKVDFGNRIIIITRMGYRKDVYKK